jgi:CheY-like chemotaxis protein
MLAVTARRKRMQVSMLLFAALGAAALTGAEFVNARQAWGLVGAITLVLLAGSLVLALRSPVDDDGSESRVGETPEEELADAAAHAPKEEATAALTRSVAHDVNNTLATILAAGRWLESQADPDDPNLETVRDIVDAARRGGELTRSLLGSGARDRLASPASSAARRGRLLVVDDEAPLRGMVRAAFERAGFRVLEAGDGEAAMAVFAANAETIDAVLLDLELPELSGIECLRRLKELSPELPVVMVTGRVLDEDTESMNIAGAHAVLSKPVEVELLVAVVQDALQSAAQPDDREP